MPKLVLNQRQRERVIDRTWNPIAPGFLIYNIGGQVYSRTYPNVPVAINTPLPKEDPVPFGFVFAPDPVPPFVLIANAVSLSSVYATGSTTDLGAVALPQQVQNLTTPPDTFQVATGALSVGTTSTPLSPQSFQVKRITILASSANKGTVWISSQRNTPAGIGFPLAAGAAKDLGDLSASKKIDLSAVYLIGTDPADTVQVEYEY